MTDPTPRARNLRFYEAAWRRARVVPPHHWPVHRRNEPTALLHALAEVGLVPSHARWIVLVSVLTKRSLDELQHLVVRAVGIDRAISVKAALASRLPLGRLGGALSPSSGAIPEAACRP